MTSTLYIRACIKDAHDAEQGQAMWWNNPIVPFVPEEEPEATNKAYTLEVLICVNTDD